MPAAPIVMLGRVIASITVSPSILVYGANNKSWHGYLERGVWKEC